MSSKAKIFVSLVIVGGGLDMARLLLLWRPEHIAGFVVYCVIAVLASGLKLRLPGITGTISVGFLFILIGIVSLSLPEVLITGCLAVLLQYFWHSTKKLRLVQVLFNITSASITITLSYHAFHSSWLRSLPLELPVMLAILGCTYYFSTTILVAAVIALTEDRSIRNVWYASYLWFFPYYLLGAATAGLFDIARRRLGWQSSMLVLPAAFLVYRSCRTYLGRLEDGKTHAEEMAALHLRTIESLAMAIEAKDRTTHVHLQRVQVYAMEIGKELSLSEVEMRALQTASLLHDIGKIAVPEHILCKPGKLTPEEFEKIKVHPVVGAEILARAQFPYPVVPIVRSHHEKWDGSGYPDGLKGEEIPIGARILSAVDCLDALASDRQYRRAFPLSKAMEMVVEQSGKAFDPQIVAILQRRYIELEQMARSSQVETLTLSTDIRIERGAAPDAGFEQVAQKAQADGRSPSANLGTVFGALERTAGALPGKDAFSVLAGRVQEVVPCDCMVVYSRRGSTLTPEHVSGVHAERLWALKIVVGEGLSGWVAANDMPIVNGDPSVDCAELAGHAEQPGLQSALAVPVGSGQGVDGVLTIFRTHANAFSMGDLQELSAAGASLGQFLQPAKGWHGTPRSVYPIVA